MDQFWCLTLVTGLVLIILVLSRDIYKLGGSPFLSVANETLKVLGLVGRPAIKLGSHLFVKGWEGGASLLLKVFTKR